VTPSDDDSGLVVELCEPEGFVALYRREAELVLMFCTRRVSDAETALDLLPRPSRRPSEVVRRFGDRRGQRPARGC